MLSRFSIAYKNFRHTRRLAAFFAAIAVLCAVVVAPISAAAAADNPPAADSSCVGLVIDSGTGDPVTACVPFRDGMTGQDVLAGSQQNLSFDSHGLLCQINRYPDKCTSDNTHYWSYYHRAPQADDPQWTLSNDGAATYKVHPGETEGWVYQNGKTRDPAVISYQQLTRSATDTAPSSTAPSPNNASTSSGINPISAVLAGASAIVVVLIVGMSISRRRSLRKHQEQ